MTEKKFTLIAEADLIGTATILSLCELAGVSKSGYYDWKGRPPKPQTTDEKIVTSLFIKSGKKAGYRTLKMEFEEKFKRPINTKKIRRIRSESGERTKRRCTTSGRRAFSDGEESRVAPNEVKRNFENMNHVFIDITELRICNGQKAFVFAAKRGGSRELVVFEVASRPTMDLVLRATEEFLSTEKDPHLLTIHSDQGVHFTCRKFRELLEEYGVRQSMSRKGNCLDNAYIETFFGHLKDELRFKDCKNVKELRPRLKKYQEYYNFKRPQWTLKRKTPAEARVKLSLVF